MANINTSKILGPDGQPIQKQSLIEEIEDAQLTGVRNLWSHGSIASGLTPVRLAEVLEAAAQGDHHDFLTLAEEMEERDLHYGCELGKRKLAVSGIEPVVEAGGDDQKSEDIATEIRQLIRLPSMNSLIDGCLDGLGKGYGAVQQDWDTSSRQWMPNGYTWRDPRCFAIDRDNGRDLRLLTDVNPVEGELLGTYRWVMHTPTVKMGLPIRGALARLAATVYMLKSFALGDWMTFAEIFGMPIRIGKYHSGATPDEKATLRRAVANIGTDASAIMPEQMKIELLERSKSSGGEKLYETLCLFLDKQTSKGILGQTMTADDGASNSQAQVHNEVRLDICRSDTRQLAATINRDVIIPYVKLNYGAQDNYPVVTFPIAEPEDLEALTNGLKELVPLGLRVSASQVREKFALRKPQDEEEILGQTQTAAPNEDAYANSPKKPAPKVALNRAQASAADNLDEIEDELLEDWQPQLNGVKAALQALLDNASDEHDFKARLPQLMETMDVDELIDSLADGLYRAHGIGDAE